MPDVGAVCASHDLSLVDVLPSHFGLVAHVRDQGGRHLILKETQPTQHDRLDEALAWMAWQDRDVVPRFVADLGDGLHLREFIDGEILSDLRDQGRAHAAEAGHLLAVLHRPVARRVTAPATWRDVEAAKLAVSVHLDERMRRIGVGMAERLSASMEPTVLIHGDFYHRNLVLTTRGLVAIDPLARRDFAAADIASFVLTCGGDDHGGVIDELLRGYGTTPPLVREYLTFLAIRNRHYRGMYEARADGGDDWQPCYVAAGDGLTWVA